MDSTELNDIKDSRTNHDVFKKKFTSLSRPRQPLRETNANLPTIASKWKQKHPLSHSPPKGKDSRKLSPNKLKSTTTTVSPIAKETKDGYKSPREGDELSDSDIEKVTDTTTKDFGQDTNARVVCRKRENHAPGLFPFEPIREPIHGMAIPKKRRRTYILGMDNSEDDKTTAAVRRKLSNTDKIEQTAFQLKEDASIESTVVEEHLDGKISREREESPANRHDDPPKSSSVESKVTSAKEYAPQVQAKIEQQKKIRKDVKPSQKQHTEPSTELEKTRTLTDNHDTTKVSNVPSKETKAPLQELDTNKLDRRLLEKPEKRKITQQQTQNQKGTARLSGEELYQWQQSWKKIMRESVVFFEGTHDFQLSEYKRAVKYLKYVGSEIAPFYRTNVTIIISKRTYDDKMEYPSNDIFSNVPKFKTKVWSYEKLFRFMKNLGLNNISDDQLSTGASVNANTTANNNLYNLLKEEKLYGVADRDPNARRDDFHYFSKNYLYVYDLSQTVRPIAIREWGNDYPVLHLTLDGKCPFIEDPSDQNLERKRLKRFKKFEATKSHRQALRAATERVINGVSLSAGRFNGTSTSTDKVEESSNGEVEFRQPLTRNSSCMQSKAVDAMASGFNGASNAVQFSMDSNLNSTAVAAGNGLGPSLSQVQSKNLNNLKRRIFLKRKTSERRDKESTPGYCENCRCKYDNFEDHIYSNRHRNFACDDRNFTDIDELIATLKESNSMGNITSNGDYI